jgi:hypothetical protein
MAGALAVLQFLALLGRQQAHHLLVSGLANLVNPLALLLFAEGSIAANPLDLRARALPDALALFKHILGDACLLPARFLFWAPGFVTLLSIPEVCFGQRRGL